MTIRLGLLLIAIAGGGLPLDAQSPTFEVVSVKPNTGRATTNRPAVHIDEPP